jgi:hypothetical protein
VPITPPTVNTTTTTCQVNGDTRAMTCQNSCTPTTASAVANPAAPTAAAITVSVLLLSSLFPNRC